MYMESIIMVRMCVWEREGGKEERGRKDIHVWYGCVGGKRGMRGWRLERERERERERPGFALFSSELLRSFSSMDTEE